MNKVVIITGASSGIGKTTATYLASKGYIVYGLSRRGVQDNFNSIKCDVTNRAEIEKTFKDIYDKEGRIDVLVNNAGMGISGAIEYIDNARTRDLFNLNTLAYYDTCQVAIPYLRKTKGHIVNISSIAAIIPIPYQTAYSSSKAAINLFTESLRLELKDSGIKVSAIMPGDTKTGFTSARIKDNNETGYNGKLSRSIKRMEHDEQNGKSPLTVSKEIEKVILSNNPKALISVGFEYKFVYFLSKALPNRLLLFIVDKVYNN